MIFRVSIIFMFFFFKFISAQESDTIVVYEEVIVHDTVYIKEEIPQKIALKKEELPKAKNKINNKNFEFGISVLAGIKDTKYFRSLNKNNNIGFGGGVYIKRSFAKNLFSISLAANYLHYRKTFEIDANKENSELNGYYFTDENEPILFQKLNDQSTEITIPLKFYFNLLQNISPYFGALGSYSRYRMEFLIPENKILNKKSDFISNSKSLGFLYGLQFTQNKWSIFVEYQQNNLQKLRFDNSEAGNINFTFEKGFVNKKILFGINYSIIN